MSQPSTVDKPWGHELIWALTERTRMLVLESDARCTAGT
jgi:hypothetical protein